MNGKSYCESHRKTCPPTALLADEIKVQDPRYLDQSVMNEKQWLQH